MCMKDTEEVTDVKNEDVGAPAAAGLPHEADGNIGAGESSAAAAVGSDTPIRAEEAPGAAPPNDEEELAANKRKIEALEAATIDTAVPALPNSISPSPPKKRVEELETATTGTTGPAPSNPVPSLITAVEDCSVENDLAEEEQLAESKTRIEELEAATLEDAGPGLENDGTAATGMARKDIPVEVEERAEWKARIEELETTTAEKDPANGDIVGGEQELAENKARVESLEAATQESPGQPEREDTVGKNDGAASESESSTNEEEEAKKLTENKKRIEELEEATLLDAVHQSLIDDEAGKVTKQAKDLPVGGAAGHHNVPEGIDSGVEEQLTEIEINGEALWKSEVAADETGSEAPEEQNEETRKIVTPTVTPPEVTNAEPESAKKYPEELEAEAHQGGVQLNEKDNDTSSETLITPSDTEAPVPELLNEHSSNGSAPQKEIEKAGEQHIEPQSPNMIPVQESTVPAGDDVQKPDFSPARDNARLRGGGGGWYDLGLLD